MHRPRRAAVRTDGRVPSPIVRLPGQTLWCLALSWFWMIVFAAPVFLLGIWLLTVSRTNSNQIGHTISLPLWIHADQSLLATWQQPLLGLCARSSAHAWWSRAPHPTSSG